jgi:hypothetical protein
LVFYGAPAKGKFFEQGEVTPLPASAISRSVAGHGFEPAPKRFFVIERARVAGDTQQCLLQRITRFVFLPPRDDEQELVEPVEVARMKFTERLLVV